MKIRLVVALLGFAISFSLPTSAQEQSAVDPKTRQEIEAVGIQYLEAFNKHDPAAVAALYTQNAVRVDEPPGFGNLFVGRKAIEKFYGQEFSASWSSSPAVVKLVQMYALEDTIFTVSEYSVGPYHGHSMKIYVPDADGWKIRMELVTKAPVVTH